MKKSLIALAAAALLMTGCANQAKYLQHVGMDSVQVAPLQKGDYKVLGTAQGESCASKHWWPLLLAIPLPVAYDDVTGFEGPWTDASMHTRESALQQANISFPDADALLFPKYETKSKSFLVYSKVCTKVSALAIKFNLGNN